MMSILTRVFRYARMYSLSMRLLGGHNSRRITVNKYIRQSDGDKILDIGCGPGDIVQYLPHVTYVGFDSNQDYINQAKQRFGQQGLFFCNSIHTYSVEDVEKHSYDITIAIGLLHHLNDTESTELFNIARTALRSAGRLITLDNCYTENQSRLEKFLLSKDRGKFIRTPEGYRDLALHHFGNVKVIIETNLLRVPYSHVVLECSN
jgi:cyclopropane fatty-acyl-phospholipid synthase-like methyltransferase